MIDFRDWYGKAVVDRDGKKVGSIGQLYVDDRNNEPTWATVKTGLFGTKENFFPVSMAHTHGDEIVIDMPEETVKNAPRVDADQELADTEADELYNYYKGKWQDADNADREDGRNANMADRSEGTVGRDTSGGTTDNAMTRSEERLNVSKQKHEVGRVKLKKYIVTENVTTTVPIEREEVRLEREPITEANMDQATDGPTLSEEEHEIALHEERPIVSKETVPMERVRLSKDTVRDKKTIKRGIKKEQVDIQGDGDKKSQAL